MQPNNLPTLLRTAKRGTKVGWKVVGGEVPPETAEQFAQIALAKGVTRSELTRQLVTEFVEREVGKAA